MKPLCHVEIIRSDGTREHHELSKHNLLNSVHQLIGAECCDSVNLRNGKVMMVDDTGMIDGKPINDEATKIYHEKCGGMTPNSIHGDVAIVVDKDFA